LKSRGRIGQSLFNSKKRKKGFGLMKTEWLKGQLKLIAEFCRYCFSYKFLKSGFWLYSPCKMVCDLVFYALKLMKAEGLSDVKIAQLLNSYMIPNILVDRDWIENDITILLIAPELQSYLVWEHYIQENKKWIKSRMQED
jgi:hypothetical protein